MTGFDVILEKIQGDTQLVQNFTNNVKEQMTSSANILSNEQLQQSLRTLMDEADHLESSRLALLAEYDDYATLYHPHTRKRRSLLPFVGSALKFLFGSATEKDIDEVKHNVVQLRENQKTIIHVIEHSISIINMTRHEVSKNRIAINNLITVQNKLENHLKMITGRIEKQLNEFQNYAVLYNHITLVINQIKELIVMSDRRIDIICGQLNTLSIGHLSPEIITPLHLKALLMEIQSVIPKQYELPSNPKDELWSFYSMLRCSTVLFNNSMTVIVDIPLLDINQKMNLHKIHNLEIPYINETVQLNGPQITAQYDIPQQAILVNDEKNHYATLGVSELQHCSQISTDFCSIQSPIYQSSMSRDYAYAHFSKDKIKIKQFCDIKIKKNSLPKGEYLFKGHWVIASTTQLTFTVLCDSRTVGPTQHSEIVANGPISFIHLKANCKAYNSHMILDSFF